MSVDQAPDAYELRKSGQRAGHSRSRPGRRTELSIETAPALHGSGAGRTLLTDALTLIPAGAPVFAAVSPGNTRSLRAFLASGFTPVASEVLIDPGKGR